MDGLDIADSMENGRLVDLAQVYELLVVGDSADKLYCSVYLLSVGLMLERDVLLIIEDCCQTDSTVRAWSFVASYLANESYPMSNAAQFTSLTYPDAFATVMNLSPIFMRVADIGVFIEIVVQFAKINQIYQLDADDVVARLNDRLIN